MGRYNFELERVRPGQVLADAAAARLRHKEEQALKMFQAMDDPERIRIARQYEAIIPQGLRHALKGLTIRDKCLRGLEIMVERGTL